MELKIYDKDGMLRLTAAPNASSVVLEEVGGECSVSAAFVHTEFVRLDVGDYIEVSGVRYKLKLPYRPTQKNTQTYHYSVKLYAPIHDAEDTLMLFTEEENTRSEFSYDGGPREHLQLWVDNMNRRAGAALWSIGTVIEAENKTIDYNNMYCWDAAFGSNGIAAAFGTEMWADGYVVNLCKAERGETVELGYMQGLTSLSQEENGEIRFFTRLFPLGSTRNIDASKYGHARLQLPSGATYVDKNTDLFGIYEATEEETFADIYPKYIGTVSSVRTEEKEDEEGRKYTVYYFKDNGMDFNPKDYEIPDLTYMLSFQTGDLAGRGNDERAFEAAWHEDTKEWEIINIYPDEDIQLPGGAIVPKPEDTYIPWNFAMPQEYIEVAEEAFAQAVDDYLAEYSFDTNKYNGSTDRNYIEQHRTPLRIGQSVRLLSDKYFKEGYKDTRITKVVRKLNDLHQATISTCDELGKSWKKSVDGQLDDLQYILKKQEEEKLDVIKTTDVKPPSNYNVFSALYSIRHIEELKRALLHKDCPDQTKFLLKFLAGADFGDFIDSMLAGKGAGILPDGRAQVERLEVRGSMTVMDLIINQIQGMEADYSFTEIGKISYVEDLGESTYRLIIEKRTDFDFMKFQENDVCFSIINTLLTGGSDYYTSWMRIITTNTQENSITVSLYPDSEVPGGTNYPPLAGYNLTRRGNSTLPEAGGFNERAQSWMLSSREGRIMFLSNVYKPILEDYNYALTIGKLPNIKALEKIPVTTNDVGVVSQIGIFERIYQFDYNGDVVPNKIDRGQWSLATAQGSTPYRMVTHESQTPTGNTYTLLEQHTVYHLGCKWGCLIDKTQLEPKWNSPAWEMLEGDKNYGMEFVSSRGWQFFRGQVNTDITAYITYSGMDITDDVMALEGLEVEWLRDSGNIPSDNTWKPVHVDGKLNTLRLTNDDMPPEWGYKVRTVMFICRIFIPVGGETQKIENYVGFNI